MDALTKPFSTHYVLLAIAGVNLRETVDKWLAAMGKQLALMGKLVDWGKAGGSWLTEVKFIYYFVLYEMELIWSTAS